MTGFRWINQHTISLLMNYSQNIQTNLFINIVISLLTCMCETEGPEPKVWCGMGDTAKTELYRVDRKIRRLLLTCMCETEGQSRRYDAVCEIHPRQNSIVWIVRYSGYYLRACARLRAQSRRYDAVWEIHPRQNSIVWIVWWMKTSPNSNSC